MGEVFRTDAKATDEDIVIGGWECVVGCPLADIVAWELLAPSVVVELFVQQGFPMLGVFGLIGVTDNQGNTYVTAKLYSTRFLLIVVLMLLVSTLSDKRLSPS